MEQTRLDRKGIFSFLAITFGVTYAIEGGLIASGFRITRLPPLYGQLIIMAVMWVPALATVLTVRLVTREGFAIANLRLGPWKPYLASGLLVPLCFVLIYGLTWLLGLNRPDWKLAQFLAMIRSAPGARLTAVPSPGLVLPALFGATLVFSPLLNGLFGFGEELGWRGYLLTRMVTVARSRRPSPIRMAWTR